MCTQTHHNKCNIASKAWPFKCVTAAPDVTCIAAASGRDAHKEQET